MDLSKLSPAPWVNCGTELFFGRQRQGTRHQQILKEADAEFCALARNAFDGDPEALTWWEANRKRRENEPSCPCVQKTSQDTATERLSHAKDPSP